MTKNIFNALSPNTEPDDINLARKVLASPGSWKQSDHVSQLEQNLSKYLGQPVVATSSGRQALYHLLQAHGIGSGDEVILQAFTCIAVPASVIWTGAKPIYADIELNSYNLSPKSINQKITSRTKAVIIQHTFGIPANLEKIKDICQQNNLVLVEDCAHALGSSFAEKPLGTHGDSAIFSFGRDKAISSIFGGAITSRHPDIIKKVRTRQDQLPQPPKSWVIQQLFHPILMQIIIPTYFTLGFGKIILKLAQKNHLLSKAIAPKECQAKKPNHISWRYSPALAQLALVQFNKIKNYTKRRQGFAKLYINNLTSTPNITLPTPYAKSHPNWIRFPIQVADPKKIYLAAKKNKIILYSWYDSPLVPNNCNLEKFHYQPGSCPQAELAAQHIVNLPTSPNLTTSDINRVIQVIKNHA